MKLLEPITIKNITLKNRMVIPAICGDTADNGYVTQATRDYYTARARGKWGLIVFEATAPRFPGGVILPKVLGISDDKYIPGLKEVVDDIHAEGVPVVIQLVDGGRQTKSAWGGIPLSASDITYEYLYPEPPKEVTLEEIDWLVDLHTKAAERAVKAGFDGIEIHCGHGYLLSSFISPYCNRRTDEYGGSLEKRMKFPLRIMETVRSVIGENMYLSARINATDLLSTGGLELEEAKKVAQMLVDASVDVISITAGIREADSQLKDYSMYLPRGVWAFMGAEMKKAVGNVPVAIANRINRPELAEQILQETGVDLIKMGRGSMADAEFPKKVMEGRFDDIRTCIGCPGGGGNNPLWGGDRPDRQLSQITCTVNPALRHGLENEPLKPAETIKKILVAGGGPAGMKAATILAQRGHTVTLCEKSQQLGGQLRYSSRIGTLREFETLANELSYQVYKRGVAVRLGTEATPEYIKEFKPDVLIIATGVEEKAPLNISGIKDTDVKIVFIHELLREPQSYEWTKLGERVAVFCAGICCRADSWFGCEFISALVEKGKKVTFITNFEDMAVSQPWPGVRFLRLRMEEAGVRKVVNAKLIRFDKSGVVVHRDGKDETIPVDSLIPALIKSNTQLIDALRGKVEVKEIYQVGDCAKVGCAEMAISDGFITALKI